MKAQAVSLQSVYAEFRLRFDRSASRANLVLIGIPSGLKDSGSHVKQTMVTNIFTDNEIRVLIAQSIIVHVVDFHAWR